MKTIVMFQPDGLQADGLSALISASKQFSLISCTASLRSIPSVLESSRPDFLVISSILLTSTRICSECLGLLESYRHKRDKPHTLVVVLLQRRQQILTSHYKRLGFDGFVFEQGSFEEFCTSLEALGQGALYLPACVADGGLKSSYGRQEARRLTCRETEVLQQISMGHSSKEIASYLGIAVSTVDVYRKRLLEKLQLHSVAELTKYAIRMGLSSL